jgi:lipoate-protein ligase A
MKIYNKMNDWNWRFGNTPQFKNSFEKKFDWAMVDVQFDVQKGVITKG